MSWHKLTLKVIDVLALLGHRCLGTHHLPFNDWFSDNANMLKDEIDQAKKKLSDQIVDELFITTSFPFKDAPLYAMLGKPEYGSCWFYPIYPESQYESFFRSFTHPGSVFRLLYTKNHSLQPSFKWESFPRPRDQVPENVSIISQITDVTYDLQIWEVKNNTPERLICYRSDLIDPQYNLEFPLKPDTKYFWTFRARYKLNGSPQATRWAFSLHPRDNTSRDIQCATDLIPYENYYRFITPSENELRAETIYAGIVHTDENEGKNLSINNNVQEVAPLRSQIKLAILPFYLKKNGARYGGHLQVPTIEAIRQALRVHNNFSPIYSYYALGDEFGTKSIDNYISIPSSGEFWVNKPFSRKFPNIYLASEIGEKLGVDVLLLVSVVTSSYGSYDVDYYLIDTDDHSVYKRSDKIHTSRFDANILSFTKLYFGGYREVD